MPVHVHVCSDEVVEYVIEAWNLCASQAFRAIIDSVIIAIEHWVRETVYLQAMYRG